MISGEAGIGKTKLTEELGRLARMTNCTFLIGRCLPNSHSPYLPFREALRGLVDRDPFADANSGEVMFNFKEVLGKGSYSQPLVLVLEDLHWADSASVQLIHFLSRNTSCMRVMLVCTYRPEDISFEVADGLSHPLFDSLRAMRREMVCTEISLDELSDEEVGVLISKILGGRVHQKVLSEVIKQGEGNPLFTIECVHSLLSHGQLSSMDGVWCFSGETISVPSTVKEVMMRRVERLPKNVRRVLEAAAVIGLQFDTGILALLMNYRPMDLLEVLEEADRQHAMVKVWPGGEFSFAHDNLQRVLYETISEARKKEIHREIGRIMEGKPRDLRSDGEIALHYHRGGDRDKCVRYSLSTGMEWLKREAVFEAVPNFQHVLDVTADQAAFVIERLQALEGMGDCQVFLANYKSGLEGYEEFMALGGEDARCARILRKIAECWSPTRLGRGLTENCLKYLDEAENCSRINDFERGELLSIRTNLALWSGDFEKADEMSTRSEMAFSRSGDQDRLADQLCFHSWIYLSQGVVEKAYDNVDRAREMFGSKRSFSQELELHRLLGEAYYHQGRMREALLAFDAVHHAASQMGDRLAMCWSQIFRTFVHLDQNEGRRAMQSAKIALDEAMESESPYMGCMANTAMALVAVNRGDLNMSNEFSEKAWKVAKDFSGAVRTPVKGLTLVARGAALSLNKRYEESNLEFDKGIEWLDGGMGCMVHLAFALCYYGESLQRQGRAEQAMDCYSRAAGLFKVLGNEVGEKRSLRVLGELRRISEGDISLEQASNLYAK